MKLGHHQLIVAVLLACAQFVMFASRPLFGDKVAYQELADLVFLSNYSQGVVKEPMYQLALNVAVAVAGPSNALSLLSVMSSILLGVGAARAISSRRGLWLFYIVFVVFYEMHLLASELLRMHLAIGVYFYVSSLRARWAMIGSLIISSLIHFSFVLLLGIKVAILGFVVISTNRDRLSRAVLLLLAVVAMGIFFFVVFLGDGVVRIFTEFIRMGFSELDSDRRFAGLRAVLLPILTVPLTLIPWKSSTASDLAARVFIGGAPFIYYLLGDEMAIRAYSLGLIFLIHRLSIVLGQINLQMHFSIMALVFLIFILTYTALSPIIILYNGSA